MFCVRCGCKIDDEDDIIVCPECGAPLNSEIEPYVPEDNRTQYEQQPAPQPQPQWQQPVTPQPQAQWQQPVTPQPQAQWQQPVTPQPQAQWQQAQPVPPVQAPWRAPKASPAPKKKRGLVIVFAAVLVAAVALLGVTQASAFMTFARQTFMEPHEYYQYVEKKEAGKAVKSFTSAYQKYVKEGAQKKNQKAHAEISVQLGTDITDMMSQSAEMDFSWLQKVTLVTDTNSTEDAFSTGIGIKLQDRSVVSGNAIIDMKEELLYVQIPELQQTYLSMDLETLMEESDVDIEEIREALEKAEEIFAALPEGEVLEKLMNKYSSLAISCITEVEKKKDILYANGVTAECTLLVATVDEDTVKDMFEAVFEEIQQDEELEELVLEIMSLQEDVDGEELYEEFLDSVSEALDQIDELEMDGEVELSVWVNKKGAVCGRSVDVEMEDTTYYAAYAFPRDGAKIGMEIEVTTDMTAVSLVGLAKMEDGKISGDAQLIVGDGEVVNFDLENVKLSGKKGIMGTIIVTLPETVADMLAGQVPFDLKTAALQLDFATKEQENSMAWSLLFEDHLFAGIEVSSKVETGEEVKLPAENQVILVEEETEMEKYMEGMSYETILENLKNAGVPEELLNNIPLE